MTNNKFEGEFEILGHKIRLENLKNPHIIRAIKERANNFLFNYTDYDNNHTDIYDTRGDHSDNYRTDRSSHSDYHVYDDYSERGGHIDATKPRRRLSSHVDHTHYEDHTQSYQDTYYDW